MKDFLENLGKVITEKAEEVSKKTGEVVDVVAKKTEQAVEVQKLKSQISLMERNSDRDYKDLGKMIYDKYKKGEEVDEIFLEWCVALAAREATIEEVKEQIAAMKGFDMCAKCGQHMEPSAKFCPKCGAKVDEEAEFEDEE